MNSVDRQRETYGFTLAVIMVLGGVLLFTLVPVGRGLIEREEPENQGLKYTRINWVSPAPGATVGRKFTAVFEDIENAQDGDFIEVWNPSTEVGLLGSTPLRTGQTRAVVECDIGEDDFTGTSDFFCARHLRGGDFELSGAMDRTFTVSPTWACFMLPSATGSAALGKEPLPVYFQAADEETYRLVVRCEEQLWAEKCGLTGDGALYTVDLECAGPVLHSDLVPQAPGSGANHLVLELVRESDGAVVTRDMMLL